jgi:hypothetical protein
MKEEINWREEYLESYSFNQKERKLLKNGAKSLSKSWWLQALYVRWKKIRGLYKDDPVENKGQMQSSFKEFEEKNKLKP